MSAIAIVSIEVTNQCAKACWFCYNRSSPGGATAWTAEELLRFGASLAVGGVQSISLGGGEPLEFPALADVVRGLAPRLYMTMTTNGLLLTEARAAELAAAGLRKLHVSVHFPDRAEEIARAIAAVRMAEAAGLAAGVNMAVSARALPAAREAAAALHAAGIGNDRIIYLPLRGGPTPTPEQLAEVAGDRRFQSMSCLLKCGASPRFASVGWDRRVAWCSYTEERRALPELTHAGLMEALRGLGLRYCGEARRDRPAA